MDWTEQAIAQLRAFWDEGHSTAEIGRRLGVTKNAIVGKAHRLDLPARPSPIRRNAADSAPQRRPSPGRTSGPTLPALAAIVPPLTRTAEPVRVQPALRAISTSPRSAGPTVSCCWPIGEPGTRSFRFCSDNATPGKPYCAQHAAIAYVKVRDRREDAA